MPGVRTRSEWLAGHQPGAVCATGEVSLDASHLLSHYQTHLSTVHEHNVAVTAKEEEEEEGEGVEDAVDLENNNNVLAGNKGRLATISQLVAEVNAHLPLVRFCIKYLYCLRKRNFSMYSCSLNSLN